MTADEIKDVLVELGMRRSDLKVIHGWVSTKCVLARYTHEKGSDSAPSAGVSVAEQPIFNCLAGGTMVMTEVGERRIAELAGSRPSLLMPDGSWRKVPVRSFGTQRLREIVLSRNGVTKTIYATPAHRWFVHSKVGDPRELITDDLRKGHALVSVLPERRTDWSMCSDGILHGIMVGDGTHVKASRNHGRVCLFGAKRALVEYVKNAVTNISYNSATDDTPEHIALSGSFGHLKQPPRLTMGQAEDYLLGYVAGLIATDGCVDDRGQVSVSSADESVLVGLRAICTYLGISTFPIGHQDRKGYGTEKTRMYRVNFVSSTLSPELFIRPDQEARFANAPAMKYERLRWVVKSIADTGKTEEVFCAEVPEFYAFALADNILTGNCFTCGNSRPLHSLVQKYSEYTGDDFSELIEELEQNAFLGPTNLPDWDQLKSAKAEEGVLMPLNESVYMGLYESAAGHPYLAKRGISVATARKLELLYDPEDLVDKGMGVRKVARILFPVRGPDGALYGFVGRDVTGRSKVKARDYAGLKKAECVLGSHLAAADNPKFVLPMEGPFDYAMAHEQGYYGCSVLHSSMTESQANIFRNLGKPAYLFYDDDKAGDKGVEEATKLLIDYIPLMRVRYPEIWIEDPNEEEGGHYVKDPGELIREDYEWMINDAQIIVPKPKAKWAKTRGR